MNTWWLLYILTLRCVYCVCRCKGASHYGLSADRKRRSQEGECTDSTSELTIATLPGDGPTSSAAVALLSDEQGLVNPAFDPSMEDNSQSGSTTSLAARSSSKKRKWGLMWDSGIHDIVNPTLKSTEKNGESGRQKNIGVCVWRGGGGRGSGVCGKTVTDEKSIDCRSVENLLVTLTQSHLCVLRHTHAHRLLTYNPALCSTFTVFVFPNGLWWKSN